MKITIINEKISQNRLKELARDNYGDLIKGVVDLERKIIALGGELHADAEELLLEQGSKQQYLWGFNILPDKVKDERIQYTSFINIRPRDNNMAIEIQKDSLKTEIKSVVDGLVE